MYRKNEFLTAKIVPSGWGRKSGRVVFTHMRKSVKNFTKCLIFNGLPYYAFYYASFTQALRNA